MPEEPRAGGRVLVLLNRKENARLLSDWLSKSYEVLAESGDELPNAPFDLAIVDEPTLYRFSNELGERKKQEEPVFLPILLVTNRQDIRQVPGNVWQRIDELLLTPLEKTQLQSRLEGLLKVRQLSLAQKHEGDELFRALVDHSVVGTYLARGQELLYMNESGRKLMGIEPEDDLTGSSPLDIVHPDDRPRIAAEREAAARQGDCLTFRGNRKEGPELMLESFEREIDFHGEKAMLGIFFDITDRYRSEVEIRKHTQALEDANRRLRESEHYKDEFLAVISHELRTPLNAIMGYGDILLTGDVGPLTGEEREYLSKILVGADRMKFLIDNLLDASRAAAGKFGVLTAQTAYAPIVESALASIQAEAEKAGITLTSSIDAPVVATLDSARIEQALGNLLGNAVKFTPRGGSISVNVSLQGDWLLTEVTDTGAGIDAENQAKLFKPFSQGDMSTTRPVGGVGLGLFIAKAIVEAHGGTMGMNSTAGKGSTFWFKLPLHAVEIKRVMESAPEKRPLP